MKESRRYRLNRVFAYRYWLSTECLVTGSTECLPTVLAIVVRKRLRFVAAVNKVNRRAIVVQYGGAVLTSLERPVKKERTVQEYRAIWQCYNLLQYKLQASNGLLSIKPLTRKKIRRVLQAKEQSGRFDRCLLSGFVQCKSTVQVAVRRNNKKKNLPWEVSQHKERRERSVRRPITATATATELTGRFERLFTVSIQ